MPYPAILMPSLSQVGNYNPASDVLRKIRLAINRTISVSLNQKCRFKIAGVLEHPRLFIYMTTITYIYINFKKNINPD